MCGRVRLQLYSVNEKDEVIMCDTPFKSVRVNNVLYTLLLWTGVSLHVSLVLSDVCCYSDSLPPWHSLALRFHSKSTMNGNHCSVYVWLGSLTWTISWVSLDWKTITLWQLYQSWQKLECRHIFYFTTFHFQMNKKNKNRLKPNLHDVTQKNL